MFWVSVDNGAGVKKMTNIRYEPTFIQANQRVLLHPSCQGRHPNELQGRVAPTNCRTSCHHSGSPRAATTWRWQSLEKRRAIINKNGGPSNYQTPREAGEPSGPICHGRAQGAQWRGNGRRSTPGQEEPWRGWRRSGDRTILFSNIDTSFYLNFNFHFLDLTILQPVTILTV